jgi:hypothetical protein
MWHNEGKAKHEEHELGNYLQTFPNLLHTESLIHDLVALSVSVPNKFMPFNNYSKNASAFLYCFILLLESYIWQLCICNLP